MTSATRIAICFGLLLAASTAAFADLAQAKAEQNLEKRSKLALENADNALKSARQAYEKGEIQQTRDLVAELWESVDLAETSLKETGKDPRRSPKWFKRAEIGLRDLLKKLDAFEREMSVDDREMLAGTIARVRGVHERLLLGLMEGKSK
ncbi:MAG TPA: hypothetical protein VN442_20005 [Bryobacteraceae bacterium]|nr:hypothetical protein [Bryobacteraceae bacterium]